MKCIQSLYLPDREVLPENPEGPCHLLVPGIWMCMKSNQRNNSLVSRRKALLQILLIMNSVAKC